MVKPLIKLFMLSSTIALWIILLPTNILWSILYIAIGIPLYLTAFYLQVIVIRTLRKRSKTLRKLIINPHRY